MFAHWFPIEVNKLLWSLRSLLSTRVAPGLLSSLLSFSPGIPPGLLFDFRSRVAPILLGLFWALFAPLVLSTLLILLVQFVKQSQDLFVNQTSFKIVDWFQRELRWFRLL
jgi:hypothetical protein